MFVFLHLYSSFYFLKLLSHPHLRQVPADGLPPGREIDIAVDFIAPPFSGQYTSYWIMASPSGQKFGQRVWVLIQVFMCTSQFSQCCMHYMQ